MLVISVCPVYALFLKSPIQYSHAVVQRHWNLVHKETRFLNCALLKSETLSCAVNLERCLCTPWPWPWHWDSPHHGKERQQCSSHQQSPWTRRGQPLWPPPQELPCPAGRGTGDIQCELGVSSAPLYLAASSNFWKRGLFYKIEGPGEGGRWTHLCRNSFKYFNLIVFTLIYSEHNRVRLNAASLDTFWRGRGAGSGIQICQISNFGGRTLILNTKMDDKTFFFFNIIVQKKKLFYCDFLTSTENI